MSVVPKPVRKAVALSKAYKAVFESPDGKLVLVDLIRRGGVLESELGDFYTGRRSVVLEIMQTLRFDETGLLELVQARLDENEQEE